MNGKIARTETIHIRVTPEEKILLDAMGGASLFFRAIISLMKGNKLILKLIYERLEMFK